MVKESEEMVRRESKAELEKRLNVTVARSRTGLMMIFCGLLLIPLFFPIGILVAIPTILAGVVLTGHFFVSSKRLSRELEGRR